MKPLDIALTLACIVLVIATLGLAVYYVSLVAEKESQIDYLNRQLYDFYNQKDSDTQTATKPKIVIDGLTVEDERRLFYHNLHVYGRVSNTGGGNAYNAFLHVIACNAEGTALDTYHYFAGITGGMSLGLDLRLGYSGSPIESWIITPIWTDAPTTPLNGTFPP